MSEAQIIFAKYPWSSWALAFFMLIVALLYLASRVIHRERSGKILDIIVATALGFYFLRGIGGTTILESLIFAAAMFLFSEAAEDFRQWRKNKRKK